MVLFKPILVLQVVVVSIGIVWLSKWNSTFWKLSPIWDSHSPSFVPPLNRKVNSDCIPPVWISIWFNTADLAFPLFLPRPLVVVFFGSDPCLFSSDKWFWWYLANNQLQRIFEGLGSDKKRLTSLSPSPLVVLNAVCFCIVYILMIFTYFEWIAGL